MFFLIAIPLAAHAQEVTNLILNPSFEDEADIVDDQWIENGWATWGDMNGLNSVVEFDEDQFIDETRSLRIEPKGDINWHFMVIYYPVAQDLGEDYTATFWAKAQEPRPISAKIKAVDNSVDVVVKDFELTTEWQEYWFTYEASAASIKYEIWVAGSDTFLWLDFASIYAGDYVEGILPSEFDGGKPVEPADKLPNTWASIKGDI
jgi:hypothetical protein